MSVAVEMVGRQLVDRGVVVDVGFLLLLLSLGCRWFEDS